MNYLIYQAYGNKDILNETIYSLLSYYYITKNKVSSEVKIVIYTDNIAAFEHYFIDKQFIFRPLNDELIKEWKGSSGFVHRVKIKILQDFFSLYQDSNVLYVDSDTVFKTDPGELFTAIADDKFVMHTMEGIIKDRGNPIMRKLFKYLYFNDITLSDGTKIRVPVMSQMWNAGVIGINDKQKDILDKVLDFTDSLYPHFPKHIVEQFAFSYYLQTVGEILPADSYIFHYWNFKEFRSVLNWFFDIYKSDPLNKLLDKIQTIDPQKLIKSKLDYERLNGLAKFIKRIFGKRWELDLKKVESEE